MTLNHLNLPVPDVAAARHFFETFFDFACAAEQGNGALVVLHGPGGFVLVLLRQPPAEAGSYPRSFHIGFICDTPEQVTAKYKKLIEAGLGPAKEPRELHGSLAFYVQALGFLLVEVSCPIYNE